MPQFNAISTGSHPPVIPPNAGPGLSTTEDSHPTGALTLPASPGTSDPVSSISWLPAPLLPYLVALLPLRDANAFAATAKRHSQFAATPQAVQRAACVSSLADFIQVEHDTRHAPPAVRQEVLVRLARRIAQLPANSRPEACAILARRMDHWSLGTLSSMLTALGADMLKEPAIVTAMAQQIRKQSTADALQLAAGLCQMGDPGMGTWRLANAVVNLSNEARMQILKRAIFDGLRESDERVRKTIAEKL